MKLFLDTADRSAIKKWLPFGIIDGITTNPSNLSKEGQNSKEVLKDICDMVDGDVSIEVVEKEPQKVYEQAKEIASLADNVVVKIPFHEDYIPVIAKLVDKGININVTLVFSLLQALIVAKLNVKYISPFIGRWDDIDVDGISLIEDIRTMLDAYDFESELLAASIRSPRHLHESIIYGADVATIPPALLEQIMKHPLTEQGIAKFDADWKKLGKSTLLD